MGVYTFPPGFGGSGCVAGLGFGVGKSVRAGKGSIVVMTVMIKTFETAVASFDHAIHSLVSISHIKKGKRETHHPTPPSPSRQPSQHKPSKLPS